MNGHEPALRGHFRTKAMRNAALFILATLTLGLGMLALFVLMNGRLPTDVQLLASLCAVTTAVATLVVTGCIAVFRDHVGATPPPSRFSERGYAALTRCSG